MNDKEYEVRYNDLSNKVKIIKVIRDFCNIELQDACNMVNELKPVTDLTYEEAKDLCDQLNEYGANATVYPDYGYRVSITSYDKNEKDSLTFCLIEKFNVDPSDIPYIFNDLDNGKEYVLLDKVKNIYEANYLGDLAVKAGATIKSERVS